MHGKTHEYAGRIVWDGNTGTGTDTYAGYSRRFRYLADGKPALRGSANPLFHGDADTHDPEDLLLAAIGGCHMLAYLALCARRGVRVVEYEDRVEGRLSLRPDGGGAFDDVLLRPHVVIAREADLDVATALHETAHASCFIANSCRVPIRHAPTVRVASPAEAGPHVSGGVRP